MGRKFTYQTLQGIYVIVNVYNNHKYVGQSVDIKKRWNTHKRELKRGTHKNFHLQHAWNFYTPSNFKFSILEECDRHEMDALEQHWIDSLKPEYNVVTDIQDWNGSAFNRKEHFPDGYIKSGESFTRPKWHLWVYGGQRNG